VPLADAYAACARLAAAHYENFPVASRLVPSRMRPHIAAVYAFARTADDFADEEGYTLAERHALLEDWHRRLLRAAGSQIAGTEVPAPHQSHHIKNTAPQRSVPDKTARLHDRGVPRSTGHRQKSTMRSE
jgi:phytoene/squalene synthetase